MSPTDLCARCGGDCPMTSCPECGGCENTGTRPCPACQPQAVGVEDDDDDGYCDHDHDEDCYDCQGFFQCRHEHCSACGGCGCPGYCDDYQTYNLRPSETGGADDA